MSLFPPPKDIKAEIFIRLPEKYRVKGKVPQWAVINKAGHPLDSFLEGPAFDAKGNLFFVDIAWGRIFRADPSGNVDLVTEYDGEPNGLKVMADGSLLVADYKNGLMAIDPKTGAVTPHCTRYRLEAFKGVNDLCVSKNGTVWFTDQGQTGLQDPTGRIFRLKPDGALDCFLGGIPSPNGLVLNKDESILFIAVTRGNNVWRAPIMPDGMPSKVGVFIQLSGGGGPDGMALTADGGLVVAHAGMGSVWVFSPLGEPLYRVRCETGITSTNVAFGGAQNRDLYITESESGHILKARLPLPGLPLPHLI
jgi:gluconolactonase